MTLHDLFSNPPNAFRQAPFWFWNHDLDKDMLSFQIDQMHEKGLGGFVMHARHGLITPYLSDKWFDCIRHACEQAQRLGMTTWAYDERDWPSGPAGGAVIADKANRLSYLRLEEEFVQGPCAYTFGPEVIAAYAGEPDGMLARIPEGPWNAPAGTVRLIKAIRFECPAILWFESYLDTLNPKACQAFIRSTYDLHEAKLGDLKALGLAGFFTDEPAFSTYPDDLSRIPWTPAFPEAFKTLKGYDLMEHLPALFLEGELGAQYRYDYWDVACTLFERSFFEPIAAWCEKRGLQLIGHALGEEPLFYQFRCNGDIFRYLKHMHMPGMDQVTGDTGGDGPLHIVPKLLSSAALLAGRERVMTETFGESGWGLSLRDMKWMADWQMVQGINYLIPHAFYYSIAERRKKDSPPSEFYQVPFWPYYRTFADYTARITAMMTGGEPVVRIAVLQPMSSLWASFAPGSPVPAELEAVEKAFAPLCKKLLELHRDFVIVDEDSLAKANAVPGGFAINNMTFKALVIPPCTWLRESTLAALGTIQKDAIIVAVGTGDVRIIGTTPRSVHFTSECSGAALVPEGDVDALENALRRVPADVELDAAPQVYYLHRRKEDRDLYFFANTSRDAIATIASLETLGRVEFWDPETGIVEPVPGQQEVDGRVEFPLNFPPVGSRLVVVDPARPLATVPPVTVRSGVRLKLCELWEFTPENGNVLTLRNWEMTTRMRHKVTEIRYRTAYVLTQSIANMRLILDGIPRHPLHVPEAVRPLMSPETEPLVLLNGTPLTVELPWEIDGQFRVLDLSAFSHAGTYTLDIIIRHHGWFPQQGLQEYAWIAGDFAIEVNDAQPHLRAVRGIKSGPWEKLGFPNFSGTGAYYTVFTPSEAFYDKRVFLEAGRVGDLLEVEVNGRNLGVRAWPPYRVELTDVLTLGENTFVLKVTNTMRNFLEGPDERNPSGLLDGAWLEVMDL